MPALSSDEVTHLAHLSRLALSASEQERFGAQLEVILTAVARVGEVAADDVPPTTHAVPVTNVVRADEVHACLPREEVLAAAPAWEDGRFRVPRILEDDQ